MIPSDWRRVGGIHPVKDGGIAAAWIAHDKESDVLHLYDCCLFRREVLAVIAEGLNARGRWIPVVSMDKDVAARLLERGCNMMPPDIKDSDAVADMAARDIQERMETGRFKVESRLKQWLDEAKSYVRSDGVIPTDSHPLMTATRVAVMHIALARRQAKKSKLTGNFPKLAIV